MPRILLSCLFPAAILWCILVLTCLALYKQRSVQSSCFLLLARLLPTFNSLSNAEDLSSNKNFSALSFLFSSLSWILFPLRSHSPEQYRKRNEMKARYLWIDLSARSYRARSCCVYDITILAPVAKTSSVEDTVLILRWIFYRNFTQAFTKWVFLEAWNVLTALDPLKDRNPGKNRNKGLSAYCLSTFVLVSW